MAGVGATLLAAAYVADAETVCVFVSEERTFSAVGCWVGWLYLDVEIFFIRDNFPVEECSVVFEAAIFAVTASIAKIDRIAFNQSINTSVY